MTAPDPTNDPGWGSAALIGFVLAFVAGTIWTYPVGAPSPLSASSSQHRAGLTSPTSSGGSTRPAAPAT